MAPKRKAEAPVEGDTIFLRCTEGTSDKFYELKIDGCAVTTRFGRAGTSGTASIQEFDSPERALAFMLKTAQQKRKKGYFDSPSDIDAAAPAPTKSAAVKRKAPKEKLPVHNDAKVDDGDVVFLRCTEGTSDKFYELKIDGSAVTTRFGRAGTSGTASIQEFDSAEEARAFMLKTSQQKRKKGYYDAPDDIAAGELQVRPKEPKKQNTTARKAPKSTAKKKALLSSEEEEDDEVDGNDEYLEFDEVYMKCTTGGSKKFYAMTITNSDVLTRYGRIGTNGVASVQSYSSNQAAHEHVSSTIQQKLDKGYEISHEDVPTAPTKISTVKRATKSGLDEASAAVQAGGVKVYLKCTTGGSNKFYEMIRHGSSVTTRYGRCGTSGVASTQEFDDEESAKVHVITTVEQKKKKGYKISDDTVQ